MIIARVVGNVWSTRKEEALTGLKFLVVQPITVKYDATGKTKLQDVGNTIVAVDRIGAGETEFVLVVSGSSARQSFEDNTTPVDAMVVGIIDKETFE